MDITEYTFNFFLTLKKVNDFMEACDLRPDWKFYAYRLNYKTSKPLSDEDINAIIKNSMGSYDDAGEAIVAIARSDGRMFWADQAKVLSFDGYEMFLPSGK